MCELSVVVYISFCCRSCSVSDIPLTSLSLLFQLFFHIDFKQARFLNCFHFVSLKNNTFKLTSHVLGNIKKQLTAFHHFIPLAFWFFYFLAFFLLTSLPLFNNSLASLFSIFLFCSIFSIEIEQEILILYLKKFK